MPAKEKKPIHEVVLNRLLVFASSGVGPSSILVREHLMILGDSDMPVEVAHEIAEILHSRLLEMLDIQPMQHLHLLASEVITDLSLRGDGKKFGGKKLEGSGTGC